jgi:hypothetical protein
MPFAGCFPEMELRSLPPYLKKSFNCKDKNDLQSLPKNKGKRLGCQVMASIL